MKALEEEVINMNMETEDIQGKEEDVTGGKDCLHHLLIPHIMMNGHMNHPLVILPLLRVMYIYNYA